MMLKLKNRNIGKFIQKISRYISTSGQSPNDKIRNIGILAHIDAGKTTTTERMLFYSGKTKSLGEVHHGNTVTDCLSQERERGITICSSAVSFSWKDYRINLLDTPGHIDFTMEVEQSLAAVDGAVVILDASAGVEAQTMTVWNQANRHKLPRIIFVNKMDRPDADFAGCISDIQSKLDAVPIPLYLPVHNGKTLTGIIDLITLKLLTWNTEDNGRSYNILPLSDEQQQQAFKRKMEIIDKVSGFDDKLANTIIENNSIENVNLEIVLEAIRNSTISQRIVPVLLGSSYKNTGVQALMNGVINYLPSPFERNEHYKCFENDFVGRVFKLTHDKQRGPLSLIRVFNGTIKKGARITTATGTNEIVQRIYEPLADEYREIEGVSSGSIAVCAGLKNTVTGDLLVNSMSSLKGAQKRIVALMNINEKEIEESHNFTIETKIPDAVYFCSIEPPSLSFQLPLENALKQIQREDPSLRVKYDETTGQTVLGGMGELHLDIIKSRILTEYKIEAHLGPLQIAYKEKIDDLTRGTWSVEKEIAGDKQNILLEMSLKSIGDDVVDKFKLDNSPEAVENLQSIRPRQMTLIKKGALSALDRGPKLGGEVVNTQIIIHNLVVGRGTADSFIMSAAAQCVQKILLDGNCRLLEPIMHLEIVLPDDKVSPVLADMGRRRGNILNVSTRGRNNKVIELHAPLSELGNYSSILRTISSGSASMSMQPYGYADMAPIEETHAIRRAQGLE